MKNKFLGQHLLQIAGLTRQQIDYLLDTAEQFLSVNQRSVKKVPTLRGKTVINLFLEPSTRTRSSFELAGKRLSADVINISGASSSVTKGETLIDTVQTLEAMNPDIVVIRHASSGAAHLVAKHLKRTSVINAGDGLHEHPTQSLLDLLTIRQSLGRVDGLTVTLVGDVLRSRVARSNIALHKILGNTVRVVAPPTLAQPDFAQLGCEVYFEMEPALKDADVVVSLRMKHEYLEDNFIPNLDEYCDYFIISEERLKSFAPKSIVLAPGPFIRGTEVSSEVIDGPRSHYHRQVENGVAVRMACLFLFGIGGSEESNFTTDAGESE